MGRIARSHQVLRISFCLDNNNQRILIIMRIIIITISIILLKVAVAVYSAYRYLLLVCTMLLFAVTVALAGHSTCMAIFSELRMVDPNHNENNNKHN